MVPYYECFVTGCKRKPIFSIEWWGLDQNGKKPEIADERYSCSSFDHLCTAGCHKNYGGYPDTIIDDAAEDEGDLPELLDLVEQAIDKKNPEKAKVIRTRASELIQFIVSGEEQLRLF